MVLQLWTQVRFPKIPKLGALGCYSSGWLLPFQQRPDLLLVFLLPVVSIEDPFDQDDWEAWQKFTASAGIQVVGDDLTVTNPKRIAKAVEQKSCNCLLLKVNQIGSVTESLKA